MKKIIIILLSCTLIGILTGCQDKEDIVEKNYSIKQINSYDCLLDDITYFDMDYIISNSKLYLYSTKKNTITNNHCKVIYENANNYSFLGKIRTYSDGEYILFKDNSNNVFCVDNEGNISNYELNNYVNIKQIMNNHKIDYMYFINTTFNHEQYFYYISGNSLYYQIGDKSAIIDIPKEEKIIYHGIRSNDNDNIYNNNDYYDQLLVLITDKNKYIVNLLEDDKCHEYEDIKCTYKLELKKTDMFNDLIIDFKNNIKYFNGKYLFTEDNKVYLIDEVK